MDAEEITEILTAVRRFVREQVVPAELEIERSDAIPDQIRKQAAAMGLFGYGIPEEYGGLGFTMTEEVRLAIEIGWTTPSFRSMFGTNNGIAGQVLVNCGTDTQKREYLPRLASGELVASFALSEPEAGSDPSGLRTRAARHDDDYVISGHKRFITNATTSDLLMVFARTGESDARDAISVFVVPSDAPGVTIGPSDHKMGQRGSVTAEIFLDQVRAPRSWLVGGEEGVGYTAAMRSLAKGRLHIAALAVGLIDRLVDESLRHATTSLQGGQPISGFQLVQAMLADSRTEAYAGRAMVLQAAASWDDGSDRRLAPSMCKLFCTEALDRSADRAVQIHGGMGYMNEVAVERFYRDARLFRLYEGTSEIQRLIIASRMIREHAQAVDSTG